MAIFARKCDRCGARTRNEEDHTPICEACVKEMALIMDAARESVHLCPVDGAEMSKEVAHMLVIDRCPQCKGVWLDGGELERIKDGVQAEAMLAVASSFSTPFA